MAEIKFDVLEKPDASGFYIYRTGDILVSETTTLIVTNEDDTYEYVFTDEDITAFNETNEGVEITTVDLSISELKDGIYTFELFSEQPNDSVDTGSHIEGFAAKITNEVIKELLGYRFRMTKSSKEFLQEKSFILSNLEYSASINNMDSFKDNLKILQKMK